MRLAHRLRSTQAMQTGISVRGFFDPVKRMTSWDRFQRIISQVGMSIGGGWYRFETSVIPLSGRQQGNPMAKQKNRPVTTMHLRRAPDLFDASLTAASPPAARSWFSQCVQRIAQSLMIGIAPKGRDGVLMLVTNQTGSHA